MKNSNTGPGKSEKQEDAAASSLVDLGPVPKAPGRPRKYTSQAEARAARAVSKRRAHEAAVVNGQIRVTVQVPAGHRAAIVAYARMLRESAKAAREKAGLAPRPSDRTRPRAFGPAEQDATLRAWRGGGTLDDLRVAGVNIEQACAWLYAVGEAGSVTEAYRHLVHETNLVRQLESRDGLFAANRVALTAVRTGQAATRPKAPRSAEDQLRQFDSADDAGDDDEEELW